MYWSSATALLLATTTNFLRGHAKLITITEHQSACSAVYTSGSRSVTVVQSTITVSPVPWTDDDANTGTSFVLEVQQLPPRKSKKRQAAPPAWVMPDGSITTVGTEAAQYVIKSTKLSTVDGGYMSTTEGVEHQPFAILEDMKPISTTFIVQGGLLNWTNTEFSDGIAQLYQLHGGQEGNGRVIAKFAGSVGPDWNPVTVAARPVNEATQGGVSEGSMTMSTITSMGSMSLGPQTSSTSGEGGLGGYSAPTESGNTSPQHSPTQSKSSAWQASASPSSTWVVSPNGVCGGSSGYTCAGSEFGHCCSPSGDCGTSNEYCGTGCQPSFGMCSPVASLASSTSMPTSAGTPSHSNSLSTLGTTSTTLSGSMQTPGMSSMSSAAMPSSTGLVSPNGHCGTKGNGGTPQGYTCSGAVFGMCCSSSGFCGNSTDYCLGGCQAAYGSCTPQTGNEITVMGECGPNWGNQTCTGGIFGPCCSTSGYCGSSNLYCAPGNCNPMFGTCNGTSSSTTAMASTSAMTSMASSKASLGSTHTSSSPMMSSSPHPSSTQTTIASSSATMVSSSTHSSSAQATMASSSAMMVSSSSIASLRATTSTSSSMLGTTTSLSKMSSSSTATTSSAAVSSSGPSSYNPQCPAANGTGFTDTAGNLYMVLCDKDTTPGAIASSPEPDLASCINACSTFPFATCVAVTFLRGTCFIKSGYYGDSNSIGTQAAVLASILGVTPAPYDPSASASMPSGMSSSSTPKTITNVAPTSSTKASYTSTGPYLVLASPTPCDFGDPSDYDEDDSYCEIDLPFTMRMYAQTDTTSYASTNGFISIQAGSQQYQAQQLPTSIIPNNTVAPFFDDLYLYAGSNPPQGIFYQLYSRDIVGTQGITYEYFLGRAGNEGPPFYHFTVAYYTNRPGVFTYTYYEVGGSADDGTFAAVGMQGIDASGTEQGFTYSFQSQDIAPGLVVECNTQANTCTTLHNPSRLKR